MTAAGFSNLTFSYPGPARAAIVRCPRTPSPHNPSDKRKRRKRLHLPPDKGKTKEKYTLEGRAWSTLFLARTHTGPLLLLTLDLQKEALQLLFFQVGPPCHDNPTRHFPHPGALQKFQDRRCCSLIPKKPSNCRRFTPLTAQPDPLL